MSEIITIVKEKLSMQLDSVGWNKKYNLVAVGAYMIDPSSSDKRIGKVFLIQLLVDDDEIVSHKLIQVVDISGVLDLRWEPLEEKRLVVATSTCLELFELEENEDQYTLQRTSILELSEMALYAQWIDKDSLVYSDSEGAVNIVGTSPFQKTVSKKVHSNLTWVVQYSQKHKLLFAGSDEGKFTGFLLENIEDDEKHYTKKFQVGITSILFFGENVLAVGSYDDTLRIFTIDCSYPIALSLKRKIEFCGAPWRTLSFPGDVRNSSGITTEFFIVAACARDGIHIVRFNCDNWASEITTTCSEFEGFLAYGLDAKLEQYVTNRKFTILSCYYDNHQLHFWKTIVPK